MIIVAIKLFSTTGCQAFLCHDYHNCVRNMTICGENEERKLHFLSIIELVAHIKAASSPLCNWFNFLYGFNLASSDILKIARYLFAFLPCHIHNFQSFQQHNCSLKLNYCHWYTIEYPSIWFDINYFTQIVQSVAVLYTKLCLSRSLLRIFYSFHVEHWITTNNF